MLGEQGKAAKKILRTSFNNFIFTFPLLTFHDFFASAKPKHLYLDKQLRNEISTSP